MHEITFSTVDKPKLLSQVVNSDFILKVLLCFVNGSLKLHCYFISYNPCYIFFSTVLLSFWHDSKQCLLHFWVVNWLRELIVMQFYAVDNYDCSVFSIDYGQIIFQLLSN